MGAYVTVQLFDVAAYRARVLPVLDRFFAGGDTAELSQELSSALKDADLSDDLRFEIEDALSILSGSVVYSPATNHRGGSISREDLERFVRNQVASALVRVDCVLEVQDVSKSRLPLFLYEHSSWIENYLTFGKSPSGGLLEYSSGECTEVFSETEAGSFLGEMRSLPEPPEEIAVGFAALAKILESADYGAGRVVALSVS